MCHSDVANQTFITMHAYLGLMWVFFFIRCSSKVGKHYAEPGSQKVSIGDGCNFVGTIIHELMHAIGKLVYSCSSLELSKQQY